MWGTTVWLWYKGRAWRKNNHGILLFHLPPLHNHSSQTRKSDLLKNISEIVWLLSLKMTKMFHTTLQVKFTLFTLVCEPNRSGLYPLIIVVVCAPLIIIIIPTLWSSSGCPLNLWSLHVDGSFSVILISSNVTF